MSKLSISGHSIANTIDIAFIAHQMSDDIVKQLALVRSNFNILSDDEKKILLDYFLTSPTPPDSPIARLIFLYDLFKDGTFLNRAISSAKSLKYLSLFSECFWNITSRLFTAKEGLGVDMTPLREEFTKISAELKNYVKFYGYTKNLKSGKSKVKNIAIISPQMIGMHHSPTREAYSIACHLITNHGCNVYIFNTNGFNYSNSLQIERPFIANANYEAENTEQVNINYLNFKDVSITLKNFVPDVMSTFKILSIVKELKSLNIDAVISHGENLFIQDVIFGLYPSVFATTGGVVPFAHCDSYFVPGNLFNKGSQDLADKFGHKNFMKESMLVTPEGKADAAFSKEDFGLHKDQFIYLVVSTRLQNEICPEFIDACNTIISRSDDSTIIFAGTNELNLNDYFDNESVTHKRVISIGFHDDIASVSLMSDVYLNPKRQGGGTSSQTAILNETPVVTLNYGHISSIVPETHRFETWDEYIEYAIKLKESPSFLNNEVQLFTKHFVEELKSAEQIETIYNRLCVISDEEYTESVTGSEKASMH